MKELAWKAVSSYIQGRGHIEHGEPCQDRTVNFKNEDVIGIVLCDGAGSCKYSEQGAVTVTELFTTITNEQFDFLYNTDNSSEWIQQYVVEALQQEIDKIENATLMDFSCTLLFSLVKGNQYLAGHVGDGVISLRVNNEITVLSHPENGRYSNETYFVTMSPLQQHFRIYKGQMTQPYDFMLMSDGAAISFYLSVEEKMEDENTRMLFNHLVENSEDMVEEELYELLKMVRKNTADDCAIAVLTSHTIEQITQSIDGDTFEEDEDDYIYSDDVTCYEDAIEEEYDDEYYDDDEPALYELDETDPQLKSLPKLPSSIKGIAQALVPDVISDNTSSLATKYLYSKKKKVSNSKKGMNRIGNSKKKSIQSKKKRIQKKHKKIKGNDNSSK